MKSKPITPSHSFLTTAIATRTAEIGDRLDIIHGYLDEMQAIVGRIHHDHPERTPQCVKFIPHPLTQAEQDYCWMMGAGFRHQSALHLHEGVKTRLSLPETARKPFSFVSADAKVGQPHYAIILRRRKKPVQKKLPEFAVQQVPVIQQLIQEFPSALIAIVDADGGKIAVWSPTEVATMARRFNAGTVIPKVNTIINEPINPQIREFIDRLLITGCVKLLKSV